jgi:hypothetical protein
MVAGMSVDWHHFIPRSQWRRLKKKQAMNEKGKALPLIKSASKLPAKPAVNEPVAVHKICHRKLHSLFTEKELAEHYATPEAVIAHPAMQDFIAWVRKQPIEYYDNSRTAKRKKP